MTALALRSPHLRRPVDYGRLQQNMDVAISNELETPRQSFRTAFYTTQVGHFSIVEVLATCEPTRSLSDKCSYILQPCRMRQVELLDTV